MEEIYPEMFKALDILSFFRWHTFEGTGVYAPDIEGITKLSLYHAYGTVLGRRLQSIVKLQIWEHQCIFRPD